MQIQEILREKGEHVVTIDPERTVLEAMRLLVQNRIGAVVVIDGGTIRGILSERDVLRVGAENPRNLETLGVQQVMTRGVITASPADTLDRVMDLMTDHRIRHLPVVVGEKLVGIVSIRDVVNALRRKVEVENEQLQAYIYSAR